MSFPVNLKLRDPSYEDEEGRLYVGDLNAIVHHTEYVLDPDECDHQASICPDCLINWHEEFIGELLVVTNNEIASIPFDDLVAALA